jgi:DNA-binding transcriptional MerR regulator
LSSRSYLSIGDVLTLLRQEFPDVTISKIRFLESQGLVNPERTPSGYRKFYEHDVERLRWVLRQQRENFLPLKVIKDRLDDDANGVGDDVGRPVTGAPTKGGSEALPEAEPAWHAPSPGRSEPVLVGQRSGTPASAGAAPPAPAVAAAASAEHGGTRSGGTLPGIDSAAHPSRTSHSPATARTGPPTTAAATSDAGERFGSERPSGSARATDAEATAAKRAAPRPSRPAGSPSAGDATARRAPAASPRPATVEGSSGAPARRAEAGGASLSLEELSAACGLHEDVLRELQEYGLLTATPVAGLDYFDQEALAVATVAAGLARFGVEPRHLRLYKNAADREAGFVEQIVLPLVRQRNPDARAKAHETAEELADLGQQLRAALLRVALRGLLDG